MTTPSATAQSQPEAAVDAPVDRMSITISLNGPYLVNGGVPLTQEVITPVGGHREYRTARAFPHQETYALCRCGQTSTPPFCDGSHVAAGFHGADGDVWTLTELSGDERLKREAVQESTDCPAGRLVHVDSETGAMYEPELGPSIALLEDPEEGVSGPLYVRGGIPLVGADGTEYELRNRYALCRCGASRNKPFCDAMHVTVGYEDGLNG